MTTPLDKPALDRCPACRYSLQGLPSVYRCPECGFEYDEGTIILSETVSKTNRWSLLLILPMFFMGPPHEIVQGLSTGGSILTTRFIFNCLATLFYIGFTGFLVRYAMYPPTVIVNSVGVHLCPYRRIRKTYSWPEIIDVRIEGHGDIRRVCKLYHVDGVQSFRFYLNHVLSFELWKTVKARLEARKQGTQSVEPPSD